MEKKHEPPCTACLKPDETDASAAVAVGERQRKANDFKALLHRFPYLRNALCGIRSGDENGGFSPVEDRQRSTYDRDYAPKRRHDISKIAEDRNDDDHEPRHAGPDKRVALKAPAPKSTPVKFTNVKPPEPYVVPISEYRATIHTIGARIIRERLLSPKAKNKRQ